MRQAVADCRLDLGGTVVLTEAATGAYAVTPVLAAMAGADQVVAVTRTTFYGTVEEVAAGTEALADSAGVAGRIEVVEAKTAELVGRADLITNSGHLRPLDAETVGWMKPSAVVSLMFEAWEIQAGRFDVDLETLRRRGIRVAGTNERHAAVDVFSYLGPMAVKLLHDAGLPVYRNRVALLCDNPFLPYLVAGLEAGGAEVVADGGLDALLDGPAPDVLLIAARPTGSAVLGGGAVDRVAAAWPGTVVAQYWGDVDRDAMAAAGVPYWPPADPGEGHMAVLPSAMGPDAIVRLQAGGLKVGEVLLTDPAERAAADAEFLDEL